MQWYRLPLGLVQHCTYSIAAQRPTHDQSYGTCAYRCAQPKKPLHNDNFR